MEVGAIHFDGVKEQMTPTSAGGEEATAQNVPPEAVVHGLFPEQETILVVYADSSTMSIVDSELIMVAEVA